MPDKCNDPLREYKVNAIRDALRRLPGVMVRNRADGFIVALSAVDGGAYMFVTDRKGTIMLGLNREVFSRGDADPGGLVAQEILASGLLDALVRGTARRGADKVPRIGDEWTHAELGNDDPAEPAAVHDDPEALKHALAAQRLPKGEGQWP